jgi:hypothetical protein
MSHKKVLWARRDFALSREGRLSRQARQNIVGEPVPIKLGLGDVPHVGHILAFTSGHYSNLYFSKKIESYLKKNGLKWYTIGTLFIYLS